MRNRTIILFRKDVDFMMKFNKTIMEIRSVHYTDRPNAIHKFINAGFSVDDIQVIRIDACRYDMIATKEGI